MFLTVSFGGRKEKTVCGAEDSAMELASPTLPFVKDIEYSVKVDIFKYVTFSYSMDV